MHKIHKYAVKYESIYLRCMQYCCRTFSHRKWLINCYDKAWWYHITDKIRFSRILNDIFVFIMYYVFVTLSMGISVHWQLFIQGLSTLEKKRREIKVFSWEHRNKFPYFSFVPCFSRRSIYVFISRSNWSQQSSV